MRYKHVSVDVATIMFLKCIVERYKFKIATYLQRIYNDSCFHFNIVCKFFLCIIIITLILNL